MMDIGKMLRLFLILGLLTPLPGYPESPPGHHSAPSPARLQLTPDLAQLLTQEMVAIQKGMQTLLPVIVSGDWKTVADIAEQIQHSYLMQQQLTAAQRETLQHALPPAFRELDQSFHRFAGRLAHAARQQDAEVVEFYFYKLTDTCVACHTRFATHRFPGLVTGRSQTEHAH
jgi:cytochrome c556